MQVERVLRTQVRRIQTCQAGSLMGLSCLSVKVKMSNIIEGKQLWQFQTGDPFSYRPGTVMRVRGQQDIRENYGASCWPIPERGNAL